MKKQQSDIDEYVPCMHGDFRKELASLINKFSKENYSDTPDFILAQYLDACLIAFSDAVMRRTEWYQPYDNDKSGDEFCEPPVEGDEA